MSDIDDSAIPGGQKGQADQVNPEDLPQFRILAQYIKDFSFENPNAPESMRPSEVPPTTDVGIDVQARRREGEEFEATIRLNITSRRDDTVSFILELEYNGVFLIKNVPEEASAPPVDRVPADAVPVPAPCCGRHHPRWRLSASDARPD